MEAGDDFDRIAETLMISREEGHGIFLEGSESIRRIHPDTYPKPSLVANILRHYKRPLQVMEVVDEIRRERRGTLDRERITPDDIDVYPHGKPKTQNVPFAIKKPLIDGLVSTDHIWALGYRIISLLRRCAYGKRSKRTN